MPVDKHKYNTCLANYFLVQPLFFDGDKQKKPHLRKCIEQPWQCNVSNNWIHLKQTLFDMSFLQTKCSSFSIYHVLEDFIFAQSTLPLDHSKTDILRLYSILDRYSRIFELAPFLIPQQVYNELYSDIDNNTILGGSVLDYNRRSSRIWLRKYYTTAAYQMEILKREFEGHSYGFTALSFSPDSKTIISGCGRENELKIWNANTGKLIVKLLNQPPFIYSPDGRMIACISKVGLLEIKDSMNWITNQIFKLSLLGGLPECYSLSFSSDSKMLALGGNHKIEIFDIKKRKYLFTFTDQPGNINSLVFSPDCKFLYAGSGSYGSNNILVWDLANRRLKEKLMGHEGFPTTLAISLDGKTLFSGSLDNTVRIWDTQQNKTKFVLSGHKDGVIALSYSSALKTIASGSRDGTIRLWDSEKAELISEFTGHKSGTSALSFSHNGQLLASGGMTYDSTIRIWSLDSGIKKSNHKIKNSNRSVITSRFYLNGQTLACLFSGEKYIYLFEANTGKFIDKIGSSESEINSFIFSNDNKLLVTSLNNGTICLWDLNNQLHKRFLNLPSVNRSGYRFPLALSNDNRLLLAGNWQINVQESEIDKISDLPTGIVMVNAFSNSQKTIATGTGNPRGSGTICIWDTKSKVLIKTLVNSTYAVYSLRYSSDDHFIAGSEGRKVSIWETDQYGLLNSWFLDKEIINRLCFSHNKKILIGSGEKSIFLWETETGKLLSLIEFSCQILSFWLNQNSPELIIALHYESNPEPVFSFYAIENYFP